MPDPPTTNQSRTQPGEKPNASAVDVPLELPVGSDVSAAGQCRTLRTLLANLPGWAYRCANDPDWTLEFVSEGFAAITGHSIEDMLSGKKTIGELMHADDRRQVWDEVQIAIKERRPFQSVYRLRHATGHWIWLWERGCGVYDEDGNFDALEGFVTDITKQKQSEDQLRRRIRAESMLADISTAFIDCPLDRLDATLEQALEQFGRFMGADRAYLFQTCDDSRLNSNTHEWCSDGIEPMISMLQNLPLDRFPWIRDRLNATAAAPGSRRDPIHVPRVDLLPDEAAAEREILLQQSIKSLVIYPLAIKGSLLGFVGLDAVRRVHTWANEDIELLGMLSESISNLLIRTKHEKVLRDSEQRFSEIFHACPAGIIISEVETGRLLDVNEAFCSFIGYARNELVGRTTSELRMWKRVEDRPHIVRMLKEQGKLRELEIVYRTKDGRDRIGLVSLDLIDLDGTTGILAMVQDISDRKKIENALRESEQRFHAFMDRIPAVAWIKDEDRRYVYCNQRFNDELLSKELDAAGVTGLTDYDIFPDEVADQLYRNDALVFERNESVQLEEDVPGIDGIIRSWLSLKFPLSDAHGREYVGGLALDLTEKIERERALRERIKELTAIHRVAHLLQDRTRSIDNQLQTIANMLPAGWQYEDVCAARLMYRGVEYTSDLWQETPWTLRANFKVGSQSGGLTPSGATDSEAQGDVGCVEVCYLKERPTHAYGPFLEEERTLIETIAEMVRIHLESREAEHVLARREQEFKALVEHSPDIITRIGRDLSVLYVNPGVRNVTGYATEDLLNRHVNGLPMSRELRDLWRESLQQVIDTGRELIIEYDLPRPPGMAGLAVSLEARLVPEFDADGRVESVLAIARDITHRKRAQEELRRSSELRRMMLSELDHRVRNNLAALSALIDISARDRENVHEFASSIKHRVRAMAAVHSLLSRGHWSSIDLRQLVEAVTGEEYHSRIEIDGPSVRVLPHQASALGMLISELATNSMKYGALSVPGGRVCIAWKQTDRLNGAGDDSKPRQVAVSQHAQTSERDSPSTNGFNDRHESTLSVPSRDSSANHILLELEWQERGGPTIVNPPSPGMGTDLIAGFVRSELRGREFFSYPQEGAHHRFELRIDMQRIGVSEA